MGKSLTLIAEDEKEVKALAIAPGGNIVQHVERDKNDPRLWDVNNSKILNIQLIDARTFKLVTGLPPPETPITPDTYRLLGMPFFELWRDEAKASGVAGDWVETHGAKSAAAWNMKVAAKLKSSKTSGSGDSTTVYGETGEWGLLKSGAWGSLGEASEASSSSASGPQDPAIGDFTDRSFDFPVVMLDVDATIPKFTSVMEKENADDGYDDYDWY